jgi:hypothetical protein
VLRQQLRILQRTQTRPLRPTRWEKLTLAVVTVRLKEVAKTARHPWRQNLFLAIFAQRTEKVKVQRGYDSGPSSSPSCSDLRQMSGSL